MIQKSVDVGHKPVTVFAARFAVAVKLEIPGMQGVDGDEDQRSRRRGFMFDRLSGQARWLGFGMQKKCGVMWRLLAAGGEHERAASQKRVAFHFVSPFEKSVIANAMGLSLQPS